MDVVDTAKHGLSKVSATAWNKIGSLAKQAAVLAIPFVSIRDIEQKANARLEQSLAKIDADFGDVIKKNVDALNNSDFWGLAFAFAPHQFFTNKVAKKVPEVSLGILDALTGHKFPVVSKLQNQLSGIKSNIFKGADGGASGGTGFGDIYDYGDIGYDFGESVMREQAQQTQPNEEQVNTKAAAAVQKLVQNPKVQKELENSPKAKAMKQAATESIITTLQEYLAFETPEEMKKVFGSNFEAYKRELEDLLPEGATEEQVAELWNQMIPQVKNNIKAMYIKQLQSVAQQVPAASEEIKNLIGQIKNL